MVEILDRLGIQSVEQEVEVINFSFDLDCQALRNSFLAFHFGVNLKKCFHFV